MVEQKEEKKKTTITAAACAIRRQWRPNSSVLLLYLILWRVYLWLEICPSDGATAHIRSQETRGLLQYSNFRNDLPRRQVQFIFVQETGRVVLQVPVEKTQGMDYHHRVLTVRAFKRVDTM